MNRSPYRLCLLMLVLSFGLAASTTVLAHAGLIKAVPAADSHVSGVPRIELTFNEALVPRATRVTLSKVGDGGALARIDHIEVELVDGNTTVRATPQHPLGPGEYEVEWRVVGADNHPITGRHRFGVH